MIVHHETGETIAMQDKKKTLSFAVALRLAAVGYTGVASVLLVPLYLEKLSPEGYGIWLTIGSVSSLLMILDPGLGNLSTQQLSVCRAKGDMDTAREVIGNSLFYMCIFAGFITIAGWLCAPFASGFLESGKNQSEVTFCLRMAAISVSCMVAVYCLQGLIAGLGFVFVGSFVLIFAPLVKPILILFALRYDAGIAGVAISELVGSAFSCIAAGVVAGKVVRASGVAVVIRARGLARYFYLFTFTSASRVAKTVASSVDGVLIGTCLGGTAAAVFGVGMMGPRLVETVIAMPFSVGRPLMAYSSRDPRARQILATRVTMLGLSALVCSVALLLLFYPLVLRFWARELEDDVARVLGPIVLLFFTKAFLNVANAIVFSLGDIKGSSIVDVIVSLFVVLLVYIGCIGYGAVGAVLGHVLAVAVVSGGYTFWRLVEISGQQVVAFIPHLLAIVLGCSLPLLDWSGLFNEYQVVRVGIYVVVILGCGGAGYLEVIRLFSLSSRGVSKSLLGNAFKH